MKTYTTTVTDLQAETVTPILLTEHPNGTFEFEELPTPAAPTRKEILTNQILRLANIYLSMPVCKANVSFHCRVIALQCEAIRAKNAL